MEIVKQRYKIWNWTIEKQTVPMSTNPTGTPSYWYALLGISDQYMQGRMVRTSRILRLDFEEGTVETQNSVYELQKEARSFPFVDPEVPHLLPA